MSSNTNTFSIDKMINPETEQPFGSKYSGDFKVRRPTIADKEQIALLDAANLAREGILDNGSLNRDVTNLSYIFAHFSVIGEELPPWFDKSKLYEEDEPAVYFAWGEVSRWLKTFRPTANPA